MKKVITRMIGYYLNTLAIVWPGLAARHGFRIFCRPFRAALKPHHRKFLDGSDKFAFYHEGIRVQGYRWGNGPRKVVLLHGWQSHSFRWKKYVESLSSAGYTVYAIDAPGHGFSAGSFLHVPLYSRVIHQLIVSLGEIHAVVSHSMGSFSILHTLHTTPFLPVNKLVLLAPPGEARDFVAFFKNMLKLSDRCVRLVSEHFVQEVHEPVHFFSTTRFAATLTMPGLIIHDVEDDETPHKYAVKIHHAWKRSRLISTQGLKHNLKSPHVVNEVKSFIEEDLIESRQQKHTEYFS